MKKLLFLFYFSLFNFVIYSQLPNINLKDVNGNNKNLSKLSNNGNPIIISFWATWCIPCINELDDINKEIEKWKDENVKIIAIATDDSRTKRRVRPMVNGKNWDFEIFLDENQDFKRALNISGLDVFPVSTNLSAVLLLPFGQRKSLLLHFLRQRCWEAIEFFDLGEI